MLNAIKKFYMKKQLLISSCIIACICWLILFVTSFTNTAYYPYAAEYGMFLLLTLGLFIAYVIGSINIQKMLFGSLLLLFIISDILILLGNTILAPEPASALVIAGTILVLVMSVIIYIAHMMQQTDHFGNTKTPYVNQCCGIIIIMNIIYLIIALKSKDFGSIVFMIGSAFSNVMVICMETRIHEYKRIRKQHRDAGTWTEEERKKAKELFKI